MLRGETKRAIAVIDNDIIRRGEEGHAEELREIVLECKEMADAAESELRRMEEEEEGG